MFSQQMAQALLAGTDKERLCHLLSKNYKSACAICCENIILHSHPEIEISFKFIPKILMSKECIHFFGPLCIYIYFLPSPGYKSGSSINPRSSGPMDRVRALQ